MIKNYLLTAWRNLTANKLNAVINVAGLTVAFTVCILLFLMVRFEFSFDQMHKYKDNLFMVYNISYAADGDQVGTSLSYPVAPTLKAEAAGIVRATGVIDGGSVIRYKGREIEKSVRLVDSDFFEMFSFPVLAGNRQAPLTGLGDIVLNETTAAAVFGKEDPVGRMVSVKIGPGWKDLRVSAVIQDVPANSSLTFNALARMELAEDFTKNKDNWNSQNHRVFVQTAPTASQEQAEAQIRLMLKRHRVGNEDYMKAKGYRKDKNGDMYALKLAPLTSLHFNNEVGIGSTVAKSYLYTLTLISIVVLIIACFNFINLNVARAFTRAREVGVRKTIGAGRGQIFVQLWVESLLLFSIAVVLALVAAVTLLPSFNALFVEKLSIASLANVSVILSSIAGALLVSLLAGGYPAWLISRFNAVEVLKGKVTVRRSGHLRSGLITFQFVMACLLICSTIVIYRQFQHMRTAPMGYAQDAVISIPVKHTENTQKYIREMRQRLASQPQIVSITGAMGNIGIGEDHGQSESDIGFLYNGKLFESELMTVDFDFLETLDIKPLAGRSFSRDFPTDTSSKSDNVIISESMARQFNEKNPVGLSLMSDTTAPKWNVIGIIPDIHLHSMHEKMKPLTLMMAKNGGLGYILVKTRSQNPMQAMTIVKETYQQIEPGNAVNPSYVSENTRRWYAKEQRLSTIFCSAAVIAILLSCLGLFAIVSLVIGQRRKEIGVRKVLGASVAGMAGMLSMDFVKLVLLAFVIATPVGWYFLHRWLQDFTYRTTISWWIFPLSGLAALVIALGTISVLTVKASMANPVKNLRTE